MTNDRLGKRLVQVDLWYTRGFTESQHPFEQLVRDRGGESPVAQLRALVDVVSSITEAETFRGCIFVNAGMEFPLQHEPAHRAAAQTKHEIEEIVCDMRDGLDPRTRRPWLRNCAYVTRHVTGEPTTIDIARRLADRVIDASCGAGVR